MNLDKLPRIASWQPQDPVTYETSDGTDEFASETWSVYSERDQAEYDRLLALDAQDAHVERMREYVLRFEDARIRLEQILEHMRRWVVEARANDRWHYAAAETPDGQKLSEFDELTINRVTLEAQQFYASHGLARFERLNLQRAELKQLEDTITDHLNYLMVGIIYGHPHKPIQTKQSKTIWWEVPASWWQMFKRDVLRRKKVRYARREQTFTMQVSATPFSAFPELPYTAPKEWGPRIDLMLQNDHPYIRLMARPGDKYFREVGQVEGG